MGYTLHLKGIGSGQTYSADQLMNLDPVDGRPVRMILDLERLQQDYPDHSWYQPQRRDMWRFGPLLPLDPNQPEDARHIVSLGEGHTPLLNASDLVPNEVRLWIKDEGHPHPGYGENPTHSFKDRGMSVVASMARRFGLDALAVPTQGNAGDSLCHYARAAGMKVVVAMPDDTPMPILGSVAAAAAMDSDVTLETVKGTIREAGELLKAEYIPNGYFNCATFQEPGWRIEGKKTLGLEIAEAVAGYQGWKLPDAIIYPTGGGTGILGMWKAFSELECLGLLGPERPRIYSVQSDVTPPLVNAFARGDADTTPVEAGQSLCVGLNVPGGVGHFEVLRIIRDSGGKALAIDEQTTANTLTDIWRRKRWWICPEGAATVAAANQLIEAGDLQAGETVVAVNTGSFEKYLPDLRHLLVERDQA